VNLPDQVRNETAIHMRMTKLHPLLEAQNFHHKLCILLEAIVGCKSSLDTRQSHDYLQYAHCAYHCIAAFSGVIKPRQDGRLHWHMMLYSSVLSSELFKKAAAASTKLQTQDAEMLDSITCTTLPTYINGTMIPLLQFNMAPNVLGLWIWMSRCLFQLYCFFVHWDEEILINGYVWSQILLQEGKKEEIHVAFSIQARTSYRADLSHFHYTFQVGKRCKKTACRCTSQTFGQRYRGNVECTK
jgi:hypothetical protein